jgi:hypothetical protein
VISEWFVTLFQGLIAWVGDLFPSWDPPAAMLGLASTMQGLMDAFVGLGVWVDWGVLSTCVGIQVSTWLIVLGIKLIRAVVAHIPEFGGAGD